MTGSCRLQACTGFIFDGQLLWSYVGTRIFSTELYKNDEYLAAFESNWTANVARSFGIPETSKNVEEITTKIRNYYTPNWEKLPKEVRLDAYTKLFTDSFFNFHMHHSILEQRKHSHVYPYYYSRRGGPSAAAFLMATSGKWPAYVEFGLLLSTIMLHKIFGWKLPDYGNGNVFVDISPKRIYLCIDAGHF